MNKKQIEKIARLGFKKKEKEFKKEMEKLIKKPLGNIIQVLLELGYKMKEIELEENSYY